MDRLTANRPGRPFPGDHQMQHAATHHLSPSERLKLQEANALLREITDGHCHSCECSLCDARASTDVQEEESYHVRYVPSEDGRN